MPAETGRDEIWLTSYPEAGRRVQVSREGGREPVWSPDSREIYYWWGDQLVAAEIATSGELRVARREELFRRPNDVRYRWHAQYDVHPDGDRFLVIAGPELTSIRLTLNWTEALREATGSR